MIADRLLYEPLVRATLLEDLGRAGDITTNAIVGEGDRTSARFVARDAGRISGMLLAELAFTVLDPTVRFDMAARDGHAVRPGDVMATVSGSTAAILTGERTALNFLGRMSGIATTTATYVEAVEGTLAQIVCTRKTTPGLRIIEKAAVRHGGGKNHRFGLDDAALIKDNHRIAAGGVRPAIERVRASVGHLVKIEVEVDTLDELREALELGVDLVLLDNMSPETLAEAVRINAGRALLEASGGVRLATVRAIAESGVNIISVGALTHSAVNLDIGLDFS